VNLNRFDCKDSTTTMETPKTTRGHTRFRSEFESFMRPYFDMLYRRAQRLTGNTADAEDLVQDLCVRVYSRFNALRSMENPKAWLFRVLHRLFIDFSRHKQRSPLRSMSSIDNAESLMELACDRPGPEASVEAEFAQERVYRALRRLRPDEQLLLVLHEIEGYGLPEIQQITDLSQGTLKSRLHRARIKLGRLLIRQDSVANNSFKGTSHELSRRRRFVG
jgi:RNA polymerase sigma-70 factor (ECF subfamily)